jgi:hypothetical protein
LPEEDIDGEERIFGHTVDMGADEYYSEDYNVMTFAHCRRPRCGRVSALYVGEAPDINLVWHPGIFAVYHDVYFGTDFNEVNDMSTSGPDPNDVYKGRQSEPNYLASDLNICTTYYWRIDEVNDTNIWPGPVWSFTTGLFIDDFERYDTTADMRRVWDTAFVPVRIPPSSLYCGTGATTTGATLSLNTGIQAMQYDYNNTGLFEEDPEALMRFSEARLEYNTTGVDWTTGDSNILSISYIGSAGNSADPTYDRMYVAIRDSTNHLGPIIFNPDANAQKNTTWQEWQIPLSVLSGGTVDLTHDVNLLIGFGQRCNKKGTGTPGGAGRVWFDNIRLYQPNCNPTYGLTADFTDDCKVDIYDVEVLNQEWLRYGEKWLCYCQADIYQDGIVDFRDFAVLAQQWLEEGP